MQGTDYVDKACERPHNSQLLGKLSNKSFLFSLAGVRLRKGILMSINISDCLI